MRELHHAVAAATRIVSSNVVQTLRLAIVPALLVGVGAGCATSSQVSRPTSDATPPTLVWQVRNLTSGEDQTIADNGSVTAQRDDQFVITLVARDPEGVARMEIAHSKSWHCSNIVPGAESEGGATATYEQFMAQSYPPDGQNRVPPEAVLVKRTTCAFHCAEAGRIAGGANVTLTGAATNFHAGTTHGQLVLVVP